MTTLSRSIKKTRRPVPKKLRDQIFERDNYRCRLQLEGCVGVAQEVDHRVPFSECQRRGWTKEQTNDPSNLQASCSTCNRRKGVKQI